MAQISFSAKIKQVYNSDGTPAYKVILVPTLKRSHCDMKAFRSHPKYGGLANSDLFQNLLVRIRRDVFKNLDHFRLDNIPDCVLVDTSKFLALVTFDV